MRKAITWLITDTHINHKKILEVRPADHTKKLFESLSREVRPQDTLIHLGDVIFKDHHQLPEWMGMVKAETKILVRGNHDKKSGGWYKARGFTHVCQSFQLEVFGCRVWFSHKPIPINLLNTWKSTQKSPAVNIHGHLHDMSHRKHMSREYFAEYYGKPYPWLLISHELQGYKPFNLEKVLGKWMRDGGAPSLG